MSLSMKAALLSVLDQGTFPGISGRLLEEIRSLDDDALRATDREFLQTWIDDYADDPIWEKAIGAAHRFQKSRIFDNLSLIWYALRARRLAEDVRYGDDLLQRERQKRHDEMLKLAKSAEDLTNFWREAMARCALLTIGRPPFPLPFEQVLHLKELNEIQTKLLRQLPGTPPPPSTRISRQDLGKNRHRSRECITFMYSMGGFMLEVCGKPFYDAVATMTNIAFPQADISVDDVRRVATQATTRSGRLRKTGALGGKKSR